MFYQIGKNLFRFVINALQFLRVVLVFLSFATVLYWILQLAGATFIAPVAPFFEGIRSTTHLFYNRTVQSGDTAVDFAFLIAAFLFLGIVWGLKFAIEEIENAEEKYDEIYKVLKKKAEEHFNLQLEKEYTTKEKKNNKILILIKFHAENLLKDSYYDKDTNAGVDEKQKQLLIIFCKNLEQKLSLQKRFLNDGLLMYFDNFKDINKILMHIENEMKVIKQICREEKWYSTASVSVETYAEDTEVLAKIKNLVILIRLNLQNMIICLGTFRQRYSLSENQKYFIEAEGLYTIDNNVQEEVYRIRKI